MSGNVARKQSTLEKFGQYELERRSEDLEGNHPEEILAWASKRFNSKLTFATGFGPEGCAIIDMIARNQLPIDIFTLDTGLFFQETYDLWARLEKHTGIRIRSVTPTVSLEQQKALYEDELWKTDPDLCCSIRKVMPLQDALRGFEAWASAIRRDQTPERADTPIVRYDPKFDLIKVSPLVNWTNEDVWSYINKYNVPTNPLHDKNYPSIGCFPCTSAVKPGEDPRAGRWRSHQKTECGLHGGNSKVGSNKLRVIQGDGGDTASL